ncbi:protransforming growth factor alpha [Loxodonta africana]|uniref:protransforming growth factor alpha n=1 Tax=Loxodonta africana TaxID=9785 RepID=UPI0030CC0D18
MGCRRSSQVRFLAAPPAPRPEEPPGAALRAGGRRQGGSIPPPRASKRPLRPRTPGLHLGLPTRAQGPVGRKALAVWGWCLKSGASCLFLRLAPLAFSRCRLQECRAAAPRLLGARSVPAPSSKPPPPVPLGGHPHWGGRVVSRAPVAKWRRGDGNRLPISALPAARRGECPQKGARSSLPPPARPPARAGGRPCLPCAFFPRTPAPLPHSGTAGRAGGWSACCLPARKMVTSAGELALFALGVLLAVCQALENTTSALSAEPPVAAAVVSHFNDCPDSHSQFCFHGTCRFLVQEDKPACVCHSGYVGARCEHADLLAVVAASQKKQAITALVVVSIVALGILIITCVLIHCCEVRKHCEWCRALICRHEKPSALLKGRTACCHSETVV